MSLTIPLNHYILYIYIYLPGKPWINLLHTVLSIYTYEYYIYRYWVFYVVWKLETFFGGSNYSFPHLKLKTETDTQLWRNPFGLTFMMHLLGLTFITHLFRTHIHGALFQTHIHGAFYSEAHSQYAHFQTHIYEAIFRTNLFGLTYLFRLTFMMHLKDSYSWRNLFKTRIQNALILTHIWDVLIWTKY